MDNFADSLFIAHGKTMDQPRVLEMGTLRSNPSLSTSVARDWFKNISLYVRTDIQDGIDVDMVGDAHDLLHVCRRNVYSFDKNKFDIIICRSVLEHLERPWIAAKQMSDCLSDNGILFVQTHQTFPIHGYPSDYFRFSKEALEILFEDAGLKTVKSDYRFPASIHSDEIPSMHACEAWLNSNIFSARN